MGAVERLVELVASFDRRDRRGVWLGGDGRALGEHAVEVGTPDTDATADSHCR